VPEQLPPAILAPLADISRWLKATRTDAVLVGGVEVSLLSRPRFTQDVDALAWVRDEDWEALVAAAAAYGIVPRIDDPLAFARRTRVLWHDAASRLDGEIPGERVRPHLLGNEECPHFQFRCSR
jgi:hypothetical protein